MRVNAPSPNSGFTVTGGPGWVRIWLTNDDSNRSSGDLYAMPGRFYPLSVAQYYPSPPAQGSGSPELVLAFEESPRLGGYTRSLGLDEAPYADLPANVGLYVGYVEGALTVGITPRNSDAITVELQPGDFFAQDVESIGFIPYALLVMP